MSASKQDQHTPGPWSFFDGEFTTEIRAPDNSKIADAHSYSRRNDSGRPDKHRRLANGRLMAAAPELLEALKMARECIIYCRGAHKDAQSGEGFPVEMFIDSALAKATGAAS